MISVELIEDSGLVREGISAPMALADDEAPSPEGGAAAPEPVG